MRRAARFLAWLIAISSLAAGVGATVAWWPGRAAPDRQWVGSLGSITGDLRLAPGGVSVVAYLERPPPPQVPNRYRRITFFRVPTQSNPTWFELPFRLHLGTSSLWTLPDGTTDWSGGNGAHLQRLSGTALPLTPPVRDVRLSVPSGAVALALLLAPTLWLVAVLVRHRKRRAAGTCPACGYDLRATPDRCPECGRVAAAAG